MSSDELNSRWVDVESKLAFLEAANDSLSDTILLQQQRIELLEQRLERLSQSMSESQSLSMDGNAALTQHEIPPHY